MAYLEINHIKKSYSDFELELSLSADQGEIVVVLGPSGSGKSTLLSIIAGLIPPDSGNIVVDGKDITQRAPRERGVGLVFQDFALFPQYNVAGNVAYGLKSRRPRPHSIEIAQKVEQLLARFALSGFGERRISGLSGGERQRVALARALAVSPALMLFDEPLGSLDASLRKELRSELRLLQRELGYTSISVTHDQEDALAVADRVVVMRNGGLVQQGSPEEIYARPRTAFVASFFGDANVLSAADLASACPQLNPITAETLFLIRSESLQVVGGADYVAAHASEAWLIKVQVDQLEYQGRDYLVRAHSLGTVGAAAINFRSTRRLVSGETIQLLLPRDAVVPLVDDR